MSPPRREIPALREDGSREILAAIYELADVIKDSKPKSNGIPVTYVLSVLVPVIIAAMFLADMNATQRAHTSSINEIKEDRELLIGDVDTLMAYIVDTRFRLAQKNFVLPDPPPLKSKRKELNK